MGGTRLQNKNNNSGLIYLSAFILPVALFLLLSAINQKLPFGTQTYLGGDMINQYIKYFSYLQSIAAGENDAFYTYTKALGGDMTGIWAYYLLSPLNIVFLFVPRAFFPAAVSLLIALKLGLCGLTMAILLLKTHNAGAEILAFSTSYAFMSYNLLYFNNIMWLDGVYMLPVIILGLERLMEGKSARLYIISLSLALIFNYYIGYMICIFLVLFFLHGMLTGKAGGKKTVLAAVYRFAAASVISGAMAAVVLVPTALSLSGTKASFDTAKLGMFPMYTLGQLLSKLVCGAVPTGFIQGDELMGELPSVYCGALVTALLLIYFFNREIKLSVRLVSFCLCAVLFLSFNYNGTYVIWHAFNYPALFPYRNAFLASFLMIWFAWQCYIHRSGIKIREVLLCCASLVLILALIDPFHNLMVSRKLMLLDVAAIIIGLVFILNEGTFLSKRLCVAVLTGIQCLLLLLNAQGYANGYLNAEAFAASFDSAQKSVDSVKNYDDGFYRLAKTNTESNTSMLHLYNGLDHFSSAEKTSTKEFVINFGFWHFHDVWVHYLGGGTSAGDAFLGFKYLLGDVPEYKGYAVVPGREFYLNPNALDIAIVSERNVLTADLETDDIFQWQERAFSSVLGDSSGIFVPEQDVEFQLINMSEEPFEGGGTEYNKVDPAQEHALIYRFEVTDDAPLYMYTTMPRVEAEIIADLSVNGKSVGPYMGSYYWRAVCLGSFEPGEQLEVKINPRATYFLQNATYFAYEDQQALAQACEQIRLRSENARLEKVRNSYLRWTGSVTEETPVLLFTVPHDKGWRAEVDGEPTDIQTALDTLISIELTPGEHTVELRFTPPGLYAGLGISLGAMLIFIVLILKKKI